MGMIKIYHFKLPQEKNKLKGETMKIGGAMRLKYNVCMYEILKE